MKPRVTEGSSELTTPECDKWSEFHESAVAIEEFLDYCGSQGIFLQRVVDPNGIGQPYVSTKHSDKELIYRHFGIDSNKLEAERRELLRSISK